MACGNGRASNQIRKNSRICPIYLCLYQKAYTKIRCSETTAGMP